MTNPYTPVTVTGYNSSPPPDNGSTGTDNQLTWAKHKTKLGDPLKTALESVNTNVTSAFATAVDHKSFHVHKNGTGQTGVSSGTATLVTFSTESFDTGGQFASNKFTCSTAGKYYFYAVVKFTAQALYDNEIRLFKNGTDIVALTNYFIAYDGGANTGQPSMIVSTILDLSVSDYIEVYVHQESGGALTIAGETYNTYFCGNRVDE